MYCVGGKSQVPGPKDTWWVHKLMCHTDIRARTKLCRSTQKYLVLQVSYRSSECDHNHIFLIYPYILDVVAAISHMRGGIQRSLLSQSKRHRSQLKTHTEFTIEHNFMLEFNIIPCYTDCTFFHDSSGRMSDITPFSHLMIRVSVKLKHIWVYEEWCVRKKSPV